MSNCHYAASKEDEARVGEECLRLAPLLGGAAMGGSGSKLTLAKLVRGIASGDVRRYCEDRERRVLVGGRMLGSGFRSTYFPANYHPVWHLGSAIVASQVLMVFHPDFQPTSNTHASTKAKD